VIDDEGSNSILINGTSAPTQVSASGSILILDYSATDRLLIQNGVAGSIGTYQFGDGSTYSYSELVGQFSAIGLSGTDAQGKQYLLGGSGWDNLWSSAAGTTLSGGRGDDVINVYFAGGSTVRYASGDGLDSIGWDRDTVRTGQNVLALGSGIGVVDVRLHKSGSDAETGNVILGVGATGQGMRLWQDAATLNATQGPFDTIGFADGSSEAWQKLLAMRVLIDVARPGDVTGTVQADEVYGTADSRAISTGFGNDWVHAGSGNEAISVGRGNDVVEFGMGFGSDTLSLGDTADTQATDTIRFDATLNRADARFYRTGSDLVVHFAGQPDQLLVYGYFSLPVTAGVEFSDGTRYVASTLPLSPVQDLATQGADVLALTPGDDIFDAQGGNDQITNAGSGNDLIRGGAGDDSVFGGDGNDTIYGDSGNDLLTDGLGDDVIDGGAGSDLMHAGSGNNTYLFGVGDGADVINASGDSTAGYVNTVQFKVGVASEGVTVRWADPDNTFNPSDLVLTVVSTGDSIRIKNLRTDQYAPIRQVKFADGTTWNLATLQAKAVTGTESADDLRGTYQADTIQGNGGDDYIDGMQGNDVLFGGAGDDYICGGDGNDIIDAGAGNDYLDGSAGNDTYQFGKGDGQDSIYGSGATPVGVSTLQFKSGVLASEVVVSRVYDADYEDNVALELTIKGATDKVMISGFFANENPSGPDNPIQQVRFADGVIWDLAALQARANGAFVNRVPTLAVALPDQSVNEGAPLNITVPSTAFTDPDAGDVLGYQAMQANGSALPSWLTFNAATRTFTGTPGANALGVTSVQVTATDTGGLTASDIFNIAVNVQNQTLNGTSGADTLTGRSGNDTINGLAGNDKLTGAAGNDKLDGGAGTDTMIGGTGDDTYVVDATADVVTELLSEGTDLVQSTATYTLLANVENLTLTETTAINGTGNTLDNLLTGNGANNTLTGAAGNDTLDGGLGNDTMVGGIGNDTYVVNVTTDVITENASEGTDTVQSAVAWTLSTNLENLTLTGSSAINGTGNASANILIGNAGSNSLSGLAGSDTLDGGAGNDTLNGGAAADTYQFARGYGIDTVQDNDSTAGVKDQIKFAAGIAQSDLTFNKVGNNLETLINGSTDKIVVQDWYLGSQYHVEEFRFNDGSVLTDSQVQGLVSAMAGFAAPTSAQTDTPNMWRGTPPQNLAPNALM
jgi:Ca2+-binding RTX toxin-like protein